MWVDELTDERVATVRSRPSACCGQRDDGPKGRSCVAICVPVRQRVVDSVLTDGNRGQRHEQPFGPRDALMRV